MKRKLKRLISSMLALALIITMMPALSMDALAWGVSDIKLSGLEYSTDGDGNKVVTALTVSYRLPGEAAGWGTCDCYIGIQSRKLQEVDGQLKWDPRFAKDRKHPVSSVDAVSEQLKTRLQIKGFSNESFQAFGGDHLNIETKVSFETPLKMGEKYYMYMYTLSKGHCECGNGECFYPDAFIGEIRLIDLMNMKEGDVVKKGDMLCRGEDYGYIVFENFYFGLAWTDYAGYGINNAEYWAVKSDFPEYAINKSYVPSWYESTDVFVCTEHYTEEGEFEVYLEPFDHTHEKGTQHEATEGACNKLGTVEYWDCNDTRCDEKLDSEGRVLEDIYTDIVADGHQYKAGSSKCELCDEVCLHSTIKDGVCTACGQPCPHNKLDGGVCTVCGYVCEHKNMTNGVCDICKWHENHIYIGETASAASCWVHCAVEGCDFRDLWAHVQGKDGRCEFCGYGMINFADPTVALKNAKEGDDAITTGLTVTIPENTYTVEDMSVEGDAAEGYVATYVDNSDKGLDIDLYIWKHEGMNLRQVAQDETDKEITYQLINKIPVATYVDVDKDNDGTAYHTLTAVFEAGDKYAELVLWLNKGTEALDEALLADALNIVKTLANTVSANEKEVKADFAMGCLSLSVTGKQYISSHDELFDSQYQTGYYYSLDADNNVDFDTYEWKVDAEDPDLATAARNENINAKAATINGVEVYSYDDVEDGWKTRTYIMQSGDTYYEYVFYLDGDNAENIVNEIMNTLVGSHSFAENGRYAFVTTNNKPLLKYEKVCSGCGLCVKDYVDAKSTEADGYITFTATTPEGKSYASERVIATYTVRYNGVDEEYQYHEVATLKADSVKKWTVDGVDMAFGKSYSFIVTKNTEVTTADAEEAKPVAAVRIDRSAVSKAIISLEWSMPSGYKLIQAGIYRGVDADPEALKATTAKVSSMKTANGLYDLNVNLSEASQKKTVCAIGFIKYVDPDGNTKTLMTEYVTAAPAAN